MTNEPLRVARVFDATPEEMWDAWTEPERFADWFHPGPADLAILEFDVRPGGRLRFDAGPSSGARRPQEAVFHVLEPSARVAFGSADRSFLADARIEPHGKSRCRLTVELTGLLPDGHGEEAWRQRFDHLEVDLARNTLVEGQTVQLDRVFECTREEMWEAWTDAKLYAHWISPFPALDAEVHEFEPRVGGRSRFTMIGTKGERYPETSFLFLKLDRPSEIEMFEANRDRPDAFDGHPMLMHARFEAQSEERTRLLLDIHGFPKEFPAEVAGQGFGASLDKLAALLGKRQGAASR